MKVNERLKKWISVALCLCMLLQNAPVRVFAEETDVNTSHVDILPASDEQCNCGTDDTAIHAVNCPVYAAPENPRCFCQVKCVETNVWCDVCGVDFTKCGGIDTAAAYSESRSYHLTIKPDFVKVDSVLGGSFDPETQTITVRDVDEVRLFLNNPLSEDAFGIDCLTIGQNVYYSFGEEWGVTFAQNTFCFNPGVIKGDITIEAKIPVKITVDMAGSTCVNSNDYTVINNIATYNTPTYYGEYLDLSAIENSFQKPGYILAGILDNNGTPIENPRYFQIDSSKLCLTLVWVECAHEKHTKEGCPSCGLKGPETHCTVSEENKATCTNCAVCDICDEIYGEPDPNAHAFEASTCTLCGARKLFFESHVSWSEVYAYYWCAENSNMVTWPGIKMTTVKDDIYSVALPANAEMVIFNNGDENNKTPDLTIGQKNCLFYQSPDDWNWYNYPCTEHSWQNGTCSDCRTACSHTGGSATCTQKAVCETCGIRYGALAKHRFDDTSKCVNRTAQAAARTDIGGTAAYHGTLEEAIAAAANCTQADNAVVTLLDDHSGPLKIRSGVFTLDLNGKCLSYFGDYVLSLSGGADMTITDSAENGSISSRDGYGIQVTGSRLTFSGGRISVTYTGIRVTDGSLTVTGGKISSDEAWGVSIYENSTATISGGEISGSERQMGDDLYCESGSIVKLVLKEDGSGVTFPNGLKVGGPALKDILGEGAAYWQGDRMIFPTDDQTSISGGDVTLKAPCRHEQAAYSEITDTTHRAVCACGYDAVEAHTHTARAEGATITVSCGKCSKALGTATLSVADKVYDGITIHPSVDTSGVLATNEFYVSYTKNGEPLNESLKNAGTYIASIQYGDATASVEFTIAKADPAIGTVGCGKSLYDSTAISEVVLTRTNTDVAGTLVLTDTALTPGEGTYHWKFTPTDTTNYNTITGTLTLQVIADVLEKIEAAGTLKQSAYVYGDSFSLEGLTVTATYTSGTTRDITEQVAFNETLSVGQTAVELGYQGKTCTVTGISVAKKQLVISGMDWNVPESAVFNGAEYTAVLEGTLPNGVTATLSGHKAVRAGSYTAKAAFSLTEGYSPDNYLIVNGADLTKTWSIRKATATVDTIPTQKHFHYAAAANALDLSSYLPNDRGETTYTLEASTDGMFEDNITLTGSTLSYTTKVTQTAATGTIQVKAVMDNYDDMIVRVPVELVAVTAQTKDRIDRKDLTQVPAGLPNYTVAAIKEQQQRVLVEAMGNRTLDGIAHYDMKLQFSPDGGVTWVDATEANFPKEGLTVTLPYPSGTGKNSHEFFVSHMFTTGSNAGKTETPVVTRNGNDIQFTLMGLSPVSVAWSAIDFNVAIADTAHGTVTVSHAKAACGTLVTIKATPNFGYRLSTLTVTDSRGNICILGTDNDDSYVFTMPAANVTVKATFVSNSTAVADTTNPKTGDDFHMAFWGSMMMTTMLGVASLLLNKKKFFQK